jgi:hypothetical protein
MTYNAIDGHRPYFILCLNSEGRRRHTALWNGEHGITRMGNKGAIVTVALSSAGTIVDIQLRHRKQLSSLRCF